MRTHHGHESNHEDLQGASAMLKLKELVGEAKTCFFCTNETAGHAGRSRQGGARPMSVQEVDDQGNLWFLSADDSNKNEELATDASVRLYFQGSKRADFLELNGVAKVSKDKERIHELWKPAHKAWFREGIDDPSITVIKVEPTDGHYWDTKNGQVLAGIKMLIGAATGKRPDIGVEGELRV